MRAIKRQEGDLDIEMMSKVSFECKLAVSHRTVAC